MNYCADQTKWKVMMRWNQVRERRTCVPLFRLFPALTLLSCKALSLTHHELLLHLTDTIFNLNIYIYIYCFVLFQHFSGSGARVLCAVPDAWWDPAECVAWHGHPLVPRASRSHCGHLPVQLPRDDSPVDVPHGRGNWKHNALEAVRTRPGSYNDARQVGAGLKLFSISFKAT